MSAVRYIRADGCLNLQFDRMTIASQSDLNILDAFDHRAHLKSEFLGEHQGLLELFLIDEEHIANVNICRHCFSYNFL